MLLSIQKASIENKSRLRIIAFILIGISILYGTHLRYVAITQTEVYIPIRADAFDYFNYASNLATWGIYSKQAVDKNSLEPPVPDSLRSVGFPAFASLFITDNVNASVDSAIFAQTFLQILCLILLYNRHCKFVGHWVGNSDSIFALVVSTFSVCQCLLSF